MKRRTEMDEVSRKEAIDRAHRKIELEKKKEETVVKNVKTIAKKEGKMNSTTIKKVNKIHRET